MSEAPAGIFISHSSLDRGIAERICRGIESRGLRCWLSSRDVAGGDNYQAAVVRAIRSAKVMLLVFTTHANSSDEIKKELVLASQSRLVVIPLRIEDVAPEDAFAYELATRQWIDMFDDWERGMDRVASRIATVLPAPVPAATGSPTPVRRRGSAGKIAVLVSGVVLAAAAVGFLLVQRSDQTAIPAPAPTPPTVATTTEGRPTETPKATTPAPEQHPARRSGEPDEAVKSGDAAFDRKDYTEALRLYRPAAEQGNAKAQTSLGILYEEGWGVGQDYAEAMRWFRLAAAQGEPRAQNRAGLMYARGLGVPQDYAEAMRWYRMAADQGFAVAQNNVGALYQRGNGVQQDYAEAMRWYRKAADQGFDVAELNIGMLYAQGLGVQRDMDQARTWVGKAAAAGSARAKQWLANH